MAEKKVVAQAKEPEREKEAEPEVDKSNPRENELVEIMQLIAFPEPDKYLDLIKQICNTQKIDRRRVHKID
jgi:hypothetical protein